MNVEEEFKNFVSGDAEQSTNNEGAENVKTKAEENGTQASTDSTEYERELTDKEIDQIIRDSYKWYAGNGERLLGREEYRRRRVMTDKEFVALIKELEARSIEADVSNPFPLEALSPVFKNLAVSFSKTWEVPAETVAMPMISV